MGRGPSRRDVLAGAAAGAGLALVGCGGNGRAGVDGAGPDQPDAARAGADAAPDAAPAITPPEATPEVAQFGLGVTAGDLVDDRAVLWTRYDGTAVLAVIAWRMDGDSYVEELGPFAATPVEGGFTHVPVVGLVAGARYRYAFFELDGETMDRTGRSLIGRFRAPIAADATEIITFGAVSCLDESKPADTLARAAENPALDAFLFLGDNAYCEDCQVLADYREFYRRHYGRPEHVAIRAATGTYMTWDDHEVDNDWNPETIAPERLAAAFHCFFDHAPIDRVVEAPNRIWRSARWGKTVEVFVLDCRSERKPSTILNGDPQQYISPEQLQWLKDGLVASPCAFKLIMNSVPITDMPFLWDFYSVDRWEGYPQQRADILQFIDDQAIRGVLWVSGDFHLAFTAFVSPEGAGPGQTQREILVGPGGQEPNPLTWTLAPPQFQYVTGTNNYTWIQFDPGTNEIRIGYIDGSGAVIHTDTFSG